MRRAWHGNPYWLFCLLGVLLLASEVSGRSFRWLQEDEDLEQVEPAEPEEKQTCKHYHHGNASLSLCVLEAEEYESQNTRVAHLNLYLNNTSERGICNLTVWVEGMGTRHVVDFWPKYINMTDTEIYLAPGEGLEVGANIKRDEGWPKFYLAAGYHTCRSPDYAPKGYTLCQTHNGDSDALKLEFCEDRWFDSWMENDGSRTVHAQGTVSNNGTADICFLNFTVSRLGDATNAWPEWFPRMNTANTVAPLRPGDIMDVGADVPSAGFQRPQLSLLGFAPCPPNYEAHGDSHVAKPKPRIRKPVKETEEKESRTSRDGEDKVEEERVEAEVDLNGDR